MPAAGPQGTRKAQLRVRKKPAKVQAPKPAVNAQTYVSQGRAVEKVANQQRKSAKIRKSITAIHGDKPQTAQQRKANPGPSPGSKVMRRAAYEGYLYDRARGRGSQNIKDRAGRQSQAAVVGSPVLKVLDQTTRPLHAIAAGTDAAITGKNVLRAASRGIHNQDKTTFSDVLKHAGVKNKTVRGVVGFGLDVGLDPTTYVTGGTASLSRKAAVKAAEDASKTALAKGLTADQAKRFGERAAKQAERKAPAATGVTVKFAGKEVPGVAKATAHAGRPVGKVVRKVTPARGKDVLADVNPNAVPRGVSKATSDAAVNATRTARGKINTAERDAVAVAHGIHSQIGPANYNRVVDAIEAGKINRLPADLAGHAHTLRSQNRHILKVQRRAGNKLGEIKYRRIVVPKVTADVAGAQKALRAAQVERSLVERAHRGQVHKAGVAEGKARVLVGQSDRKLAKSGSNGQPAKASVAAPKTAWYKPSKGKGSEPGRGLLTKNGDLHTWNESEGSHKDKARLLSDRPHEFMHASEMLHIRADGRVEAADNMRANFHKGGRDAILKQVVERDPRLYFIDRHGHRVEGGNGKGMVPKREAGTRPTRTLNRLETERGKLYAMDQGSVVSKARQAVHDAAAHLETTKAEARTQRGAVIRATNRKAAQKSQPKEYVYRQVTQDVAQAEAKKVGRPSGGTRPASSKTRTERRRLAIVRAESPGKYREDLHALTAERLAQGHTAAAKATLNRDLADLGRPVKRGTNAALKEGEAVFHVKGSEITEVTDKKAIDRISQPLRMNKAGTKLKGANKQGGRYVVLNREIVARAKEGAAPTLKGPGIIHVFDKTTGGFKRVALATPGFHIRNLVGDTAQAYIKQPGHKLPGNFRRSSKVLKALGEKEAAKRELRPVNKSGHTIKTGQYGHVPLEQVADNLVKHGAARSGYTARELNELAASGGKKAPGRIGRGMKRIGQTKPAAASKRALLNREDLPRVATAVHALQNGASWEEAARAVADTHFDYAHLTSFERNVARRLLPFYTWSARNIPFTAKNVVARPGKYANFQKIREEAAKAGQPGNTDQKTRDLYKQLAAAGVKLPSGWEKYLSEWEQRNAGVPVSIGGKKFTESIGLPLQDLNEFPGAAGTKQASEYYQKGMSLVNPVIKDPVEYFENHSFFFRDQLQRDTSPNVAAPSYVGTFPDPLKKKLGVVKIQDKKSGKMVWGWPGKMDYLAKAVPGTPNYAQQLATGGTDRRGKGTVGKALAFAGLKSVPIDPVKNAVNLAYARQQELQKQLAGLRQQGIGLTKGKRSTPEYVKLNAQLKIVTQIAYQGKASQGYKVMPTQGGPKKVRGSVTWDGGGSGVKWDNQSAGAKWDSP